MADTITTVELYIWNHFITAINGQPAVGAKLYTYQASTSTPKAAYHDPFLLTPHANPIVLDDQGAADIYLDGHYNLRLFTPTDVLVWSVDDFTFPQEGTPVPPDQILTGSNEATISAIAGSAPLSVSGLVPLGYRCEGVLMRVNTAFGTSGGLQQIACGDSTLLDGWGVIGLEAGLTTLQQDLRRADRPIAATPYTILLSPLGGQYDATGSITVKAFFSSLAGWS